MHQCCIGWNKGSLAGNAPNHAVFEVIQPATASGPRTLALRAARREAGPGGHECRRTWPHLRLVEHGTVPYGTKLRS